MNDRQVIIIVLVAIGIGMLWYMANKPTQTTEYDAKNFVVNDAQGKYPEADVEVLSTNYSQNSWKIKVKATLNASSSCPERIHLYYDYPAFQFSTRQPEFITKNCQICINVPECVIVFPEEALIASHTFPGTEAVKTFLVQHPTAKGNAKQLSSYKNFRNVWKIEWGEWKGPEVQGLYEMMDERGSVIEIGDWGSDGAK
ncbi:MAG: hypothetical protein V1909_05945 [Candidatus Micrarchaeota archaeon]